MALYPTESHALPVQNLPVPEQWEQAHIFQVWLRKPLSLSEGKPGNSTAWSRPHAVMHLANAFDKNFEDS